MVERTISRSMAICTAIAILGGSTPVLSQSQNQPDALTLAALAHAKGLSGNTVPAPTMADTSNANDTIAPAPRPTMPPAPVLGPDPNSPTAADGGASASRLDNARPTYRTKSTTAPIAGDGRVHSPSEIEVGYAQLRPNEVATVNVWPFIGTRLTFPYTVKDVALFDDKTFKVQKYNNSVLINVVDCEQGCMARMEVFLDDGELTAVPYLLVVDQKQHTPTFARNYTDPVSDRVKAMGDSLRASFAAKTDRDVAAKLEPEVERCLVDGFNFQPVHLGSEYRDSNTGETLRLTIVDAGYSGACLSSPRLYLRYLISNSRYQEATDIAFHAVWRDQHSGNERDARIIEDQRTPHNVPALRRVRGTLVLDGRDHVNAGEVLVVRLTIDGHNLEVSPVLTAPPALGGHS